MVCWRELLYNRSFGKGNIILVRTDDVVRILMCRFLDEGEERRGLLHSVNDKGTSEYLVAAMFRVYLCETEHLRVCQAASELLLHSVEIFNLCR